MRLKPLVTISVVAVAVSALAPAHGETLSLESAGTRGGVSNPWDHARFYQIEAFVNWNLPWRWTWGEDWSVQSRLGLSGGWINGRGEDAVIGTAGSSFELGWKKFPLTLDAGSGPTVLGREQFGNTDFGTVLQFTSYAALNWKPGRRWTISARFQHMSNANIGPSNPGLNLYMLGAGWRF